MPTIQILVHVCDSFDVDLPGPPGPGHRSLFSNDLVLDRYDGSTPGSGLPQNEGQLLAGTHSGFLTVLRDAAATDRFFPPGSRLFQYEGTYKFNTLDDTPLQKGQVTATRRASLSGREQPGDTN